MLRPGSFNPISFKLSIRKLVHSRLLSGGNSEMKEQIAVIGMGGLFPGSKTIDEFWENLVENKSQVTQSSGNKQGA